MSGDLLTFGFALVKKESQVDANETRGKAMAGKLTKQEKSWILYDVGNSAFVLLATALIPVYFKTLAEPGSSVVVAWGYAETVASLLLALLMPVLGSLADLKGNKKKFFIGTVGTGAIALAALGIPSAVCSAAAMGLYLQMRHVSGGPGTGIALAQLYLPCAVYGLVILGGAALGPTGWCCGKKRS